MGDTGETRWLDVIAIGRSSVDLYGQQIGARLEDIASFAKSVGGCPANIAIGTARLGLRSALVTRVGAEQMGSFIREQLAREGVETRGVVTDPQRLTALVLLAVEADHTSPMIFYREDCADMALRPRLHRLRPCPGCHRHAFLPPEYRRGAMEGDPRREGGRHAGRARC
jgi:sugar/nucleoside kinase (ribokinase family)